MATPFDSSVQRHASWLERLSAQVVPRVVQAISRLGQEPRPTGCVKLKGETMTYRVRIGIYRVVYMVDDSERVVRITRVRHRREAYD